MKYILNHNIPFEKYFEEISRIPRGSGNETGIANYLVGFAQEHGFRFYRDDLNNVVIYKPGTPGYEDAPTVILQAHIDMVCVKEPWSDHDFLKDPLALVYENGILRANGTSLGADDGAGVATILGLLAEKDINCPPLEALFTASEETGMYGAAGFDYTQLHGKRMIGMDSGGENKSSVNAAACETIELKLPVKTKPCSGQVMHLEIGGLKGGHSGECIDMERGNAIKIAAGFLREYFRRNISITISRFDAGTVSNVIPSLCQVEFITDDARLVKELTQKYADSLRQNVRYDEPDLTIHLSGADGSAEAVCGEDSRRLTELLTLLPSGRRSKSTQIQDFVTASSNLATVHMGGNTVEIGFSLRADSDLKLAALEDEVEIIAHLVGAEAEKLEKTPCWEYQPESKMRAKAAELMPVEMGMPLIEEFVHGGLECGYFASNIPGLDIYVIGPIGREVHSTKEWLDLESAHRVYAFLLKYLAELKD